MGPVQEGHDARVIEASHGLGLGHEPMLGILEALQVTSKLDGHLPIQSSVACSPDLAHAPLTERPDEPIAIVKREQTGAIWDRGGRCVLSHAVILPA